jgi:hypothetical protein
MLAKSSRLVALSTLLSLTSLAVPAAPSSKGVTVGDFAVKVTRALGYPEANRETASQNLRLAGVHLEANLDTPLTEGRAADYMRELGVQATVSGNPATPMSDSRADQAAASVALSAAMQADSFSTSGSTGGTTACMGMDTRMACDQCCLGILLPRTKFPLRAVLFCAVICARIFPPPPSVSGPSY